MKVLVVCARRYNGHELWTALGVMQEAGLEFDVASTSYLIEDEVTGQRNTIKLTIDDIDPQELYKQYDGLMIVSGNMADTEAYWDNARVLKYVDVANEQGKSIAAICCSVPTVRNAAEGKKVSFFPLVRSRQRLSEAGAILQTVAVTVDQNLCTAEHQMATQMWANAFVKLLNGEDHGVNLVDSGYVPKGRPRKPIKGSVAAKAAMSKQTEFWLAPMLSREAMIDMINGVLQDRDVKVHEHGKSDSCNEGCRDIPCGNFV